MGTIQAADVPAAGGATSQNFASIYTTNTPAVAAFSPIPLDTIAAINGWVFTAPTSALTCMAAGFYLVTYTVQVTSNNREVALQHNGITVSGSRGNLQSGNYTTLSIILVMLPGDTLQLFNSSFATVILGTGTAGQTSASLNIVRIQ